ncbi:hypothetical protein SpCBS45565_g06447 [Spizellomyces sp. 'palustris']|nr:hypothetical protein SpCBS45565_g06447 [Spizellomyces sp. 'palustris']
MLFIRRLQSCVRLPIQVPLRVPRFASAQLSSISEPIAPAQSILEALGPDATITENQGILTHTPSPDFSTGHAARIASILETETPSSPLVDLVKTKPGARNRNLTLPEAFINNIMKDGKKARARRTLLDALELVQRETGQDPHKILEDAVNKVAPLIKVVSTKRGAKNVLTPTPLNERQRTRFGILWIVEAASGKKSRGTFGERIGKELLAIMNDESDALQKRMNVHKQALANRSNVVMADRRMRRAF